MKNIIRQSVLPIFLGLSACLFSCQKSNDKEKPSNPKPGIARTEVSGFDYDQFGISHNNYLAYIRSNPHFATMSAEDRFNYGQAYSDETFGSQTPESYSSFLVRFKRVEDIAAGMLGSSPSVALAEATGTELTPEMADFWDNLSQVFKDAAVSEDSYLTPEQFEDRVKIIEEGIIASYDVEMNVETLSGNEASGMLAMCAIAKFSYSYWFNNIDDWAPDDSDGFVTLSFITKAIKAVKVAAADVGGYVDAIDYCNGENIYGGICWDHKVSMNSAQSASDEKAAKLDKK